MSGETARFLHHFQPATVSGRPPLLLLHGTGGDESDLVPLGEAVLPGAALLSPRGRVLENGMPRFFRRLAEGVFDEADVIAQAQALAAFVTEAHEGYQLAKPVALGFSNGANIAAALLLLRPEALAGAVLLRAMPPLREPPPARRDGVPVLLLSGRGDPIMPPEAAGTLAGTLAARGAAVTHKTLPGGHELTQQDVVETKAFLDKLSARSGSASV